MIAFSTVDGHLHKRIWILFLIANQLNIEKGLMIYFIKNYQSYL
jgi:hypothetical protein